MIKYRIKISIEKKSTHKKKQQNRNNNYNGNIQIFIQFNFELVVNRRWGRFIYYFIRHILYYCCGYNSSIFWLICNSMKFANMQFNNILRIDKSIFSKEKLRYKCIGMHLQRNLFIFTLYLRHSICCFYLFFRSTTYLLTIHMGV